MENLESIKDIRTVASLSALVGVVGTFAYFQSRISAVEEEIKIIQDHLATIIPYADPVQLQKINTAMDDLQSKMDQTHKRVKLARRFQQAPKYVRFTSPCKSEVTTTDEDPDQDARDIADMSG